MSPHTWIHSGLSGVKSEVCLFLIHISTSRRKFMMTSKMPFLLILGDDWRDTRKDKCRKRSLAKFESKSPMMARCLMSRHNFLLLVSLSASFETTIVLTHHPKETRWLHLLCCDEVEKGYRYWGNSILTDDGEALTLTVSLCFWHNSVLFNACFINSPFQSGSSWKKIVRITWERWAGWATRQQLSEEFHWQSVEWDFDFY